MPSVVILVAIVVVVALIVIAIVIFCVCCCCWSQIPVVLLAMQRYTALHFTGVRGRAGRMSARTGVARTGP